MTSLSRWGGVGYRLRLLAVYLDDAVIGLARDAGPSVRTNYTSVYAQDTLTVGNLTANIGVRYDKQDGENLAALAAGQPGRLPSVLPAVSVAKGDIGFAWTDITPRLGLTYALGAERKTLLRASYSRFADQLGSGTASWLNPLGAQGYAYFYTTNDRQPANVTHRPDRRSAGGLRWSTAATSTRTPAASCSPTRSIPISRPRRPTSSCSASSTPCCRSSWSAST